MAEIIKREAEIVYIDKWCKDVLKKHASTRPLYGVLGMFFGLAILTVVKDICIKLNTPIDYSLGVVVGVVGCYVFIAGLLYVCDGLRDLMYVKEYIRYGKIIKRLNGERINEKESE